MTEQTTESQQFEISRRAALAGLGGLAVMGSALSTGLLGAAPRAPSPSPKRRAAVRRHCRRITAPAATKRRSAPYCAG